MYKLFSILALTATLVILTTATVFAFSSPPCPVLGGCFCPPGVVCI